MAYIVDDIAADCTEGARNAVAAGFRVELYAGGKPFLAALPGLEPGLVLLDVMMPDVNGAEVLDAIVEAGQGHVVFMMSAQDDVATAVASMRRGAQDFLLKPLDEREVKATLERAHDLLDNASEACRQEGIIKERLARITPKEMVVLRKLIAGKRNKNIAFELGVSERTVEVHRARLIRRAEADTFAGLIVFAVRAGVEPDG